MKIAVTGKGGSGKTMVAGGLARHLARMGRTVVALDADPNPNLGVALGVPAPSVERMESVLNGLLASGYTHDQPAPSPDALLDRYGVEAPEGITLLATGKIERPTDACLCCGSHTTTRRLFGDLPDDGRIVLADLEAGLNDLIWARPGQHDVVLVVAEPSAKSVEVATRACALARELGVRRIVAVANRTDTPTAAGGNEARTNHLAGLDLPTVLVPDDPAVTRADAAGTAAFDAGADGPAMAAVGRLAADLLAVD